MQSNDEPRFEGDGLGSFDEEDFSGMEDYDKGREAHTWQQAEDIAAEEANQEDEYNWHTTGLDEDEIDSDEWCDYCNGTCTGCDDYNEDDD